LILAEFETPSPILHRATSGGLREGGGEEDRAEVQGPPQRGPGTRDPASKVKTLFLEKCTFLAKNPELFLAEKF